MSPVAYNDLVGLTIAHHQLSDNKQMLTLVGSKDSKPAEFRLKTEACCCSSTWIESLIEESALDGYTIAKVENLKLNIPDIRSDFELIQHYGLAITTERGRCVIEYRNSSNGYYGGSIRVSACER